MAGKTTETFLMPGLFVVKDTAFGKWLPAIRATLGMQILVASWTVELVIFWNETAGPDGFPTDGALEAFFVPVGAIIFQARASRLDGIMASFTRLLEVRDVAIITQNLLLVESKFSV